LDEIGEMPLPLQVKLLRVIQEKTIRPLGFSEERPINCRFVFATNKDLVRYTAVDLFREDLYWRINTFVLEPTALASRSADIPLIVGSLDNEKKIKDLNAFCARIDAKTAADSKYLSGNVRTLQQIVRRYIVLEILP
jgi:two-component system, NtrC family, response regulator GlrR